MNGTIKRLATDKGYGFVTGADGTDYFFHRSVVRGSGYEALTFGDDVTFEPDPASVRGPRCTSVTPGAP